MVRKVRFKRGNSNQNDNYIGDSGEITVDLENKNIRLHDGVKAGGFISLSYEQFRSLVAQDFLNHSVSNDHDGLYYRKEEVDQLINDIDLISPSFDAQNTPLLIDNSIYGWRDIVADVRVRGTGNSSPVWSHFRNGIHAYRFDAGKMTEFWTTFHLDHDYALGTKIYPHVHWAPNTTNTGTIRWGMEYHVAKGHQQGQESIFGPTSIVYVTTVITENSQYQHFVSETSDQQAIPATSLEPDTLINIRFFRDGNNDTFPQPIYAFTSDIHYQVSRIATKNKAPNFFN